MKKNKFSPRDMILLVFLFVLIIGVVYYMAFYTPLQQELSSLAEQSATTEAQITSATGRLTEMNNMKQELERLKAEAEANQSTSSLAPFDNRDNVLHLLNILLSNTQYNLSFSEPALSPDGIVRRNVGMSFSCETYEDAKLILSSLATCPWRCMISNLTISGSEDLYESPVSVNATITFFESVNVTYLDEDFVFELPQKEPELSEEELMEDVMDYIMQIGSMTGNTNGELTANGTTDRAMIVTTLWRLEGQPRPKTRNTFVDVPSDAWFADAVNWAAENGIVGGFENYFYPLDAVTEDQLETILFRYSAMKGYTTSELKDSVQGFIDKNAVQD